GSADARRPATPGATAPGVDCAQSFDALTSSASRRPSPMKFSANSVTDSAMPGKISSHGYSSIESAPSEISEPQEDMGGCTPRPRKEMKASSSITAGMVSVV